MEAQWNDYQPSLSKQKEKMRGLPKKHVGGSSYAVATGVTLVNGMEVECI
jgi:hypothetical protein